jgi:hypothetical protein
MAFDSARRVCVLHGGSGSSGPNTWIYDGVDWTSPSVSASPGDRLDANLSFDAARGFAVLVGGGSPASTWAWDGTDWSVIVAPVSPAGRVRRLIVYDEPRRRAVSIEPSFFLVIDPHVPWEWDGRSWTPVAASGGPPTRFDFALAFDSARSTTLLFGGTNPFSNFAMGETWEWDGAAWADRTSPSGPAPRSRAAMADDPARGRVVLFGGEDCLVAGCAVFGDTWTWDGAS